MKAILVNVVPEETRMALVADDRLQYIELERQGHSHLVGNIYKGRVQNVLPGMQAAFVDIGTGRNAFMYIGNGEVHDKLPVLKDDNIHVGKVLPVQIIKDAIGTKGPRATTHISLPGRHVVLMPTAAYIGISHRIEDEAEKERLRQMASELLPEGMGLIIRTAAAGISREVLAADVNYLVRLWKSLMAKYQVVNKSSLLYRDADMVIRIVRDYLAEDIDAMIIDNREIWQRVSELVQYTMPQFLSKIKLYQERTPIFRHYGVEEQLERLGERQVELPSGGFLVIDRTEALTVIDVNTGRFVGNTNLADTVYKQNLEAADEILRQIRLRDIGGIIIVDFIDMETEAKKESLLEFMRERSKGDKTKLNIVDITALGLVEITRKKARQNYESILYTDCPCCQGRGRVESPETVCVNICRDIRRIERTSHAAEGYEVEVHETVAEELRQKKLISHLEQELCLTIKILARPGIHPENYTIQRAD